MMWLALVLACSTSPSPPTQIEAGKTNVVLIVMDTLRADRMGSYGYSLDTTPRLDAFAKQGVLVETHIANSSWTRPSMATMLTGHYPRTVGIYEEEFDRLDPEFTTLAEHMKGLGYTTLGVTSNPNLNHAFGLTQGFDAYGESGVVFKWMGKDNKGKDQKWFSSKGHHLEDATTITDRALALVDAEAHSPFYLQAIYIDPHWPYEPPETHLAWAKEHKSTHAGYDGGVRYADAEIGRLLDGLEARGLLRDTLVVFTSDHGEGLKTHRGIPESAWHGNTLYESVLHVPLVLQHPTLPRGTRLTGLTQGLDVVPTVLDLLGAPVPNDLPGQSLASAIRGEAGLPPLDHVVSETDFRVNRKIGIRTATQKYIRNDDCAAFQQQQTHEGEKLSKGQRRHLERVPPVELYALDKTELLSNNTATEQPHPLAAALEEWESTHPARPPTGRSPKDALTLGDGTVVHPSSTGEEAELDPATRSALEALGYLDDPTE